MYFTLFLLSSLYVGYNSYHVIMGTLPEWIDKRLYCLRNDASMKDIVNKRWDTPLGILSKLYYLSVFITGFIFTTYLINSFKVSIDFLFITSFLASGVITYIMQTNFMRRAHFYARGFSGKEKI